MLKTFSSDGVHLAYIDVPPEGTDRGEPILLIHGFASNHRINWVNPRWVADAVQGRAAGDRARQPRPRGEPEALRAGMTTGPTSWRATRPTCSPTRASHAPT